MKLVNTRKAVENYDAVYPTLFSKLMSCKTNEQALAVEQEMEKLGESVGLAFWEDTKDRNNIETCRKCVRPGESIPAPGSELSFVRRLLAKESL